MKGVTNVPAPVTAEEFDAVAKQAHTHDNQTVLDAITDEKIKEWDEKGSGAGDVTGPDGAAEGNLPVFADSTGKELKDSGVQPHSHDNKDVLDGITAEKVEKWDNSGDVKGPAKSVDGELVLFDGATGKRIKAGGIRVRTDTTATGDAQGSPVIALAPDNGISLVSGGSSADKAAHIFINNDTVRISTEMPALSGIGTVSLGAGAKATGQNAAQIGEGSNTKSGSLQFRDFPVVLGGDGSHYLNTVGSLSGLKTSAKTDVVSAINELKQKFDDITDGNEVLY